MGLSPGRGTKIPHAVEPLSLRSATTEGFELWTCALQEESQHCEGSHKERPLTMKIETLHPATKTNAAK